MHNWLETSNIITTLYECKLCNICIYVCVGIYAFINLPIGSLVINILPAVFTKLKMQNYTSHFLVCNILSEAVYSLSFTLAKGYSTVKWTIAFISCFAKHTLFLVYMLHLTYVGLHPLTCLSPDGLEWLQASPWPMTCRLLVATFFLSGSVMKQCFHYISICILNLFISLVFLNTHRAKTSSEPANPLLYRRWQIESKSVSPATQNSLLEWLLSSAILCFFCTVSLLHGVFAGSHTVGPYPPC